MVNTHLHPIGCSLIGREVRSQVSFCLRANIFSIAILHLDDTNALDAFLGIIIPFEDQVGGESGE